MTTDFYGGSSFNPDDVVVPTTHTVPQICEGIHSVSDDAFGFWDHTWGHPDVHESPCTNLAVMTWIDPYDGKKYLLCSGCAE